MATLDGYCRHSSVGDQGTGGEGEGGEERAGGGQHGEGGIVEERAALQVERVQSGRVREELGECCACVCACMCVCVRMWQYMYLYICTIDNEL